MFNLPLSALALVAGLGIPIMASISAALGLRLGSTVAAATVLFAGAFILSLMTLLIKEAPTRQLLFSAPPYLYTGGIFIAFYVLSITWLIPRLGVGNAIFLVLLGQILSATLIDHFGLFSAKTIPISTTRLIGIMLIAVGIFLSRRH